MIGSDLEEATWLDLCSGSGVMSCEALQKGAKKIIAIEKQRETAKICKKNLIDVSNTLNNKSYIEVICKDMLSILKKGPKNIKSDLNADSLNFDQKFDFIFLDPPYDSELYDLSQKFLLSKQWVKKTSTLICECSSKALPRIHNGWKLNKLRCYGKTSLLFLTPNQA